MPLGSLASSIQSAESFDSVLKLFYQIQLELESYRLSFVDTSGIEAQLLYQDPLKKIALWKIYLGIQLAGYSGCKIVRRSNTTTLWIIGRSSLIRIIQIVYILLVASVERFHRKRKDRNAAAEAICKIVSKAVAEARQTADPADMDRLDREMSSIKKWMLKNAKMTWS